MQKYEVLEHKADLKIRVFGKDKKELFSNALFGMAENMKAELRSERAKRKIKIKSLDLPALLVDFLSEALYLSQTQKEVYFDVRFRKLADTEIEAELLGRKVERFGEDIKAVTHHDLDIRREKDGTFEAVMLFDI